MENSLEQTLQDGKLYRHLNSLIVAHLRDNNLNQATSFLSLCNGLRLIVWNFCKSFNFMFCRLQVQLLLQLWHHWMLKPHPISFLSCWLRFLFYFAFSVFFFFDPSFDFIVDCWINNRKEVFFYLFPWLWVDNKTGSCSGERWDVKRGHFICIVWFGLIIACCIWLNPCSSHCCCWFQATTLF